MDAADIDDSEIRSLPTGGAHHKVADVSPRLVSAARAKHFEDR